jgi:Domain of unknown function (DUF5666)
MLIHTALQSKFALVLTLLAPVSLVPACLGQEQATGRALGVVEKLDAAARQITLKTSTGEIAVTVDPKAKLLRVAPGATDLSKAAPIEFSDINSGDRVRARGRAAQDQKSLLALEIVVISQNDIAGKQAAERADWERRGVTGIVSEATSDSVTVNVRALEGTKPLVITPAPNAVVRRYTPDSVKFADAKPSKLSDIRKGDQVRARGNKTADGRQMTAEEIVSGQFKMIAGLVVSVDPQENIVRINNIETKKPVAVRISADSSVKKLPPQLAQGIANRLHGGAAGAAARGGAAAVVPGETAASPAGGRGDLQSMIDHTPAIKVADLMPGDAVIVSSVNGDNSDQVTAIMLLAGVEPILTKPGSREMSLGDWNVVSGDLGGIE